MTKFFLCMNVNLNVNETMKKAKLLQIDAERLYTTPLERLYKLFEDQGRIMHDELQKYQNSQMRFLPVYLIIHSFQNMNYNLCYRSTAGELLAISGRT